MESSGISWELVTAIIGIVVAAFVAYHIAVRQGVFAKSRLFASFAAPSEDAPPDFTDVVLIAVPRSSRFQVTMLPIVMQNRGTAPIRNLWLNLAYSRDIAVRSKQEVIRLIGEVKWPDNSREEVLTNDQVNVSFEIPLIRRDETMVLGEPIAFDTNSLSDAKGSDFESFSVFFQSIAENARRFRKNVKVAFVRADDLAALQARFADVVQELVHAKGSLLVPLWLTIVSRLFRKTFRDVHCLLIVPSLQALDGEVSIDTTFFGKSGTGYQPAQLGIYVKKWPSGKPISWRKAKELRKQDPDRFA